MQQVLAERYELGHLLGTGGMAHVYDAYDKLLDRRVAVKLLRDDLPEGRGGQSVLSEARSAARLSHPHAVAVYDLGREQHRPFIVMELVEGCTLAELLQRRGRLSAEQAVAVAGQTLSALAAAHARGMVHRDVKPANILLPGCRVPDDMDTDTGVKLADFGIAKGIREAAGELTMAGKVIGTPTYLSPEQIGGRGATPRSDLYSLGVVLYEMLAGRPPFAAEGGPAAMAFAHQQSAPERLDRVRPDLPPGIVELVHRALRKDPEERYADAADMRRALRQWRRDADAVSPTLVDTGAPVAAAYADAGNRYDDAPVMTRSGSTGVHDTRQSRMAGWRPAVIVGSVALAAVLLIMAVGALSNLGGDDEPAAVATEQVADPAQEEPVQEEPVQEEPEPTEPPADPADEAAGEAPAEDEDGIQLPSLPNVSLPDPAEIGAGQLRDVVGNLPGAVVGERQDDLQSGLEEVAQAPDAEVPQEAGSLLEQVQQWTSAGELNDQIGSLVEAVLSRLASG